MCVILHIRAVKHHLGVTPLAELHMAALTDYNTDKADSSWPQIGVCKQVLQSVDVTPARTP